MRRPTVRAAFGGDEVVRLSVERFPLHDLYHWLLTTSRLYFGIWLAGIYLGLNLVFALAYLAVGDGIENARPGSFIDAFFFSVQTMATIGYGKLVPTGVAANLLVTVEAAVGLFGIAVAAGLVFARFTRPTAGVVFSRNMVVSTLDGKLTLMFRLANARDDQIHEARVHVVLVRQERSVEGLEYRRLRDLSLERGLTPVFGLSWTVMHVIDEASPLFGCTTADMAASNAAFTVLFSGHHEAFQQQVHARHAYQAADVAWNCRFADIFRTLPDGRQAIDFSCFDELVREGEAE